MLALEMLGRGKHPSAQSRCRTCQDLGRIACAAGQSAVGPAVWRLGQVRASAVGGQFHQRRHGANPRWTIDLSALPQGAAVCDIVYNPLETKLLKDAAARGHKTIDGLGMLMHQAVPSFEAFFGVRPKVTPALREALVKVAQCPPISLL
jgi:hypothetical protein